MNAYAQGVLETIGFVLSCLKSQQSRTALRTELEEIRDKILKGTSTDFKVRISSRSF